MAEQDGEYSPILSTGIARWSFFWPNQLDRIVPYLKSNRGVGDTGKVPLRNSNAPRYRSGLIVSER